ncbi:MAG: RagB/SusD family nutrient uptake outer membrane protein [Bacteroidales bacterium]|nr:RagB/SusD family nutrient uptake outer membrane protein [Bacteroidales bacterium]
MKTRIFIVLAIAAMLGSSCSDFLNEPVRGTQNLDSYFVTEEESVAYLTGCYNAITFYGWWQVYNFWLLSEMCTDDAWMGNTTQAQTDYISIAHFQGIGQTNPACNNFYQQRYRGILRCNVAIARIPESAYNNEAMKARLVAEAKFLRGFFYLELVRAFGGVPITNSFKMPDEIIGVTRNTAEEVWAQVEQDFKEAAEVLPARYGAADVGRATKYAALGMLGKAYVYQEKWSEAKAVLKQVIDSGQYDLMENFGDVWDVDTNNNKESIFELQTRFETSYNLGNAIPVVAGNRSEANDGWAWGLPSSDLEKAFIDAGDYERLRWTIIKNGDTEIAGEPDFEALMAANRYATDKTKYFIDPSMHKPARVCRKIYIPYKKRPARWTQDKIPLNQRILRLADVYLLYAEACNELHDDAEACIYLNKVRVRAKMPEVSQTGKDLQKTIRLERRLELAFENNRLWDIRRWTDDNGKKMMCNIMGPNGTFVKRNTNKDTADPYEWENQKELSNKGETFQENRDLLFPIPLHEITMSNGTIEQNPGWN